MNLKNLLLIGCLGLSSSVIAQNFVADSVNMGPGYTNDYFYSLKNGANPASDNTTWGLAFQMTPPGPYGNVSIFANHVQGGVNVYSLHMSASANFATLSAADTVGKIGDAQKLYNSDSSWNFGAFNKMNDASNPFDYSWGTYNLSTHNVQGDSLYLLTVNTGVNPQVYKIWIKEYVSTPADSVQWIFRIANFDGSNDTTIRIYRKPSYTDRLFAYYNLSAQTVSDREPGRAAWDILFTRYEEYIGAPGMPYYPVMGVLSNFDVSVAEMHNVTANDTVGYVGYNYSPILNVIGSDWKTYNMSTNMYELSDSTYYFIKTKNTNEYYQLHFTAFGGGATGKVVFEKRYLGVVTGINNVSTPISAYFVAPNPANNSVNVMVDTKEQIKNARLFVTDLTGKVVFNATVNINGMNAYNINTSNLAAGAYIVTLTNGFWRSSEKLIIQH